MSLRLFPSTTNRKRTVGTFSFSGKSHHSDVGVGLLKRPRQESKIVSKNVKQEAGGLFIVPRMFPTTLWVAPRWKPRVVHPLSVVIPNNPVAGTAVEETKLKAAIGTPQVPHLSLYHNVVALAAQKRVEKSDF